MSCHHCHPHLQLSRGRAPVLRCMRSVPHQKRSRNNVSQAKLAGITEFTQVTSEDSATHGAQPCVTDCGCRTVSGHPMLYRPEIKRLQARTLTQGHEQIAESRAVIGSSSARSLHWGSCWVCCCAVTSGTVTSPIPLGPGHSEVLSAVLIRTSTLWGCVAGFCCRFSC